MTTRQPTREQVVQLIAELEAGSNWLSGKHGVYSYNRQPKIAAMFLKAFAEQWMPELLSELRAPHDWKLEGFGHYKDVTMAKSDAPFRAADAIESLARADLEATVKEQAAEIERLSESEDGANALAEFWCDENSKSTQQLAAAQLHIEQLKEALNKAADKFHDYAEIHAAKEQTRENVAKVERNLELAAMCDKAISTHQPDLSTLEAERQRVAEACAEVCRQHPDGLNMLGGGFVACAEAIDAGQWREHLK